jgi:hypothetical protein
MISLLVHSIKVIPGRKLFLTSSAKPPENFLALADFGLILVTVWKPLRLILSEWPQCVSARQITSCFSNDLNTSSFSNLEKLLEFSLWYTPSIFQNATDKYEVTGFIADRKKINNNKIITNNNKIITNKNNNM